VLALALCQARYWTTVEPQVRELLARYSARALGIADPIARDIALDKLKGQRMHAQAAATFATLAHRPLRGRATAAIVALEALYDYVDGLTERPIERDSIDDQDVVQPFIDAFAVTSKPHNGCTAPHQAYDDGDYTGALVSEVQHAFSSLPSAGVVNETVTATATRFAEAQVRVHLATHLGHAPLKQWATVAGDATGLDWREYSAGAISSVVGAHALIAAAADPRTTADQARAPLSANVV
jgi:hypothetical protein